MEDLLKYRVSMSSDVGDAHTYKQERDRVER